MNKNEEEELAKGLCQFNRHEDIFQKFPPTIVISGATNSGKSYTFKNIIMPNTEIFRLIIVFTETPDNAPDWKPLEKIFFYKEGKKIYPYVLGKNLRVQKWNAEVFDRIFQIQEQKKKKINRFLEKKQSEENPATYLDRILIVFDDMMKPPQKLKDMVGGRSVMCRHVNISICVLSQYYAQISPMFRQNSIVIMSLKSPSLKNKKMLYEEINTRLGFKDFNRIFEFVTTKRKWGKFVFNRKNNEIEFI